MTTGAPWWKEWPLLVLLMMVLAIFGSRLTDITLRGEETRKARMAVEHQETGDWLVPRQQGEPFLSRPPLQNWIIAGLGYLRGAVDVWAVRLPSLVAMLLLSLLIYSYARSYLTPVASMATGLAFATMGQILELGRLAETDILLTLFISGSLLLWHLGRTRSWSPYLYWSLAYVCVALATLVKGPQGVVYFGGCVGAYLLYTRRLREAFTWSHLVGMLVFLVVWGSWQLPYFAKMGWEATRAIYGGDVAMRLGGNRLSLFLLHLATYPAECLACLLPWSLFLVAYAFPSFRRTIGPARDHVVFLVCCFVVTFPTCWWMPAARGRYYLPLYPCLALLIGLVIQRCWEAASQERWRQLWQRYCQFFLAAMVVTGVGLAGVSYFGKASWTIVQPALFATCFMLGCLALAGVLWLVRTQRTAAMGAVACCCIAAFLGLCTTGLQVNMLQATSEPIAERVAELVQQLPAEAQLYSIGPADHVFAYYYRKPIKLLPINVTPETLPESVHYFCSGNDADRPVQVSFPWKELAVISCERRVVRPPTRVTVVGQRMQAKAIQTVDYVTPATSTSP